MLSTEDGHADILEPDGWGGWKLIEVKNATRLRPYMLKDVGSQRWVLGAKQLCVSSVSIRLVSRRLIGSERPKSVPRFFDLDVTSRIQDIVARRSSVIERARETAEGPEPHRTTGSHCTWPFRCQFHDYCRTNADGGGHMDTGSSLG